MILLLVFCVIILSTSKILTAPKLALQGEAKLSIREIIDLPSQSIITGKISETSKNLEALAHQNHKLITKFSIGSLANKSIEISRINDKIRMREISDIKSRSELEPKATPESQFSISIKPSINVVDFVISGKPDPGFTAGNAGLDLYQGSEEVKHTSIKEFKINDQDVGMNYRIFTLNGPRAEIKYKSEKLEFNSTVSIQTDARDNYNQTPTPGFQKVDLQVHLWKYESSQEKITTTFGIGHSTTLFASHAGVIDAPQGNLCAPGNKGMHMKFGLAVETTSKYKLEAAIAIEKVKAFDNYIVYDNQFVHNSKEHDNSSEDNFDALQDSPSGLMYVTKDPVSYKCSSDSKVISCITKTTRSTKLENIATVIPAFVMAIKLSNKHVDLFINGFDAHYITPSAPAGFENTIHSTAVLAGLSFKIGDNTNPANISFNIMSNKNCSIGLLNNNIQFITTHNYSVINGNKDLENKSIQETTSLKKIPAIRDFSFCIGASSPKITLFKDVKLSIAFSIASQKNDLGVITSGKNKFPVKSEIYLGNFVVKLELRHIAIQFSTQAQFDSEFNMLENNTIKKPEGTKYKTFRTSVSIGLK